VAAWLNSSVINDVTLRRAQLVLEWVTVCELVNHLGLSNQPLRPIQPSTLSGMSTGQSAVTLCGWE